MQAQPVRGDLTSRTARRPVILSRIVCGQAHGSCQLSSVHVQGESGFMYVTNRHHKLHGSFCADARSVSVVRMSDGRVGQSIVIQRVVEDESMIFDGSGVLSEISWSLLRGHCGSESAARLAAKSTLTITIHDIECILCCRDLIQRGMIVSSLQNMHP